ncbi:MAG: hypothetical protein ABIS59_04095 [Candidatus Saccharibacteria bacterium]
MTTNSQLQFQQPILRRSISSQVLRNLVVAAQAVILWRLSVIGLWPVALVFLLLVELRFNLTHLRRSAFVHHTPQLLAGVAAVLSITAYPRAIPQAGAGILYLFWRIWLEQYTKRADDRNLLTTLLGQAFIFEAIFLTAALLDMPKIITLLLVWAAAFAGAYHLLTQRQERTAGVLAAAWALIALEVSWVTMNWLVSYTVLNGYLIVPQPAIILTVLAYCFGSIYLAQRQNQLGRKRLTEYLIIGLCIILVVIAGTTWKGSI